MLLCSDVTGLFETAAKISKCVVAVITAAPLLLRSPDMDGDGEGHGDGFVLSPPENRFAGHPYLLLLRWRSMSHRRLNAFPHDGQRCVPR